MRPLTHETPKPLLKVGDVPLLERHLLRLRDAGSGWSLMPLTLETRSPPLWRWRSLGSSHQDIQEAAPLETAGGSLRHCHYRVSALSRGKWRRALRLPFQAIDK